MTDTDHIPPERRLPPHRRDQILRSVLHGGEPHMSQSRRARVGWTAPIAVGAVAALTAVGAVALSDRDGEQPGGTPPPASQPSNLSVPLDRGPLTEAEVKDELDKRMGSDFDDFTYPYARRIDGPKGPVPVIVAVPPDRHSNDDMVIDMGHLVGAFDGPVPTPADPIRDLDSQLDANPDLGDSIYRGTPGFRKIVGIYRVADTVDRIEVRVGTPDGSKPWRVAEPHNGYVFWATWFAKADYEPGTELTVKWRAYGTDGEQIDPDLLPDQPRTITVPGQ